MTVHDKLNYLMENGIGGDIEIAHIVQTFKYPYSFTFQKDYKQIYIILVGGRNNTQVISKVENVSLSNGAGIIVDYNNNSFSTIGSVTLETTAYVSHTETEVTAGTVLNIELNSNAWYHRTLIVLGVE